MDHALLQCRLFDALFAEDQDDFWNLRMQYDANIDEENIHIIDQEFRQELLADDEMSTSETVHCSDCDDLLPQYSDDPIFNFADTLPSGENFCSVDQSSWRPDGVQLSMNSDKVVSRATYNRAIGPFCRF